MTILRGNGLGCGGGSWRKRTATTTRWRRRNVTEEEGTVPPSPLGQRLEALSVDMEVTVIPLLLLLLDDGGEFPT